MRSTTFRRFSRKSEGRSTAEADFIASTSGWVRYITLSRNTPNCYGLDGNFLVAGGCCLMVSLQSNHFSVINFKCLYFDDNVAQLRFSLGHFLDHQTVETKTKVIYNDSSHVISFS
jgi:hypothetical protein